MFGWGGVGGLGNAVVLGCGNMVVVLGCGNMVVGSIVEFLTVLLVLIGFIV